MNDKWKNDPILNGEKADTLLYYYDLTEEQLAMLPPVPKRCMSIDLDGNIKVAGDVFWKPETGTWEQTFCD